MHTFLKLVPILLALCGLPQAHGQALIQQIATDYRLFYSMPSLSYQMFSFANAAVMANTDFDSGVQSYWQDHIRSPWMDHGSHAIDDYADLTQYPIAIPVYLVTQWVGNPTLATWANHCLRTLALGGPPQAIFAYALGGGRPLNAPSQWHFFQYHRAVSGHAFYGAIPLLNIAAQTENSFLKWLTLTASVLPALARINDDYHYPSQVFLGWWLAASATYTVWQADKLKSNPSRLHWHLIPMDHGICLGLAKNF